MKKMIVITVGLLIVIIYLGFVFLENFNKNDEMDYFSVIGIRFGMPHEEIIDILGEPTAINIHDTHNPPRYTINYEKITLVMNAALPPYGNVIVAIIYDPVFQFGKYGIGVGSSREAIENAYEGFEEIRFKGLPRLRRVDCTIIIQDGLTQIYFYFDENDFVNRISISRGHGP